MKKMLLKCFDRSFIDYKTLWEKKKMMVDIISPFPTMFSKDFFFKVVKSRNRVING